jgi:hypothetical protein
MQSCQQEDRVDRFLQRFISQTINVEYVDFLVAKMFGCDGYLAALEHRLNPLHYYSRLCEQGVERKAALQEARRYEKVEWKNIVERIKDAK